MYLRAPTALGEAYKHRKALLAADSLSRPQSERCLAVITSLALNRVEVSDREAALLVTEREAILQTCHEEGTAVQDVTEPSLTDMKNILTDPVVTDLCVIGEGSVGSMYVRQDKDDPASGTAFDWYDVAISADHLKTGHIYQRMCSGIGFAPIAWGTFAAQDIRKIWISDEESFEPALHNRPHQGLSLAYDSEVLTHDTLYQFKSKLMDRRAAALTTGVE